MSAGLVARLRAPLDMRADFADVLTGEWHTAAAAAFAARPVYLEGRGAVALGELFDVQGTGDGTVRFVGDLQHAERLGADLRSGEVVIDGNAGAEVGARMRRGVIAIAGTTAPRAGLGAIAGSIVIFGGAGTEAGLWSKRGSVVAFGNVTPPPTYRYTCTYQPPHLRLMLARLRERFGLPVTAQHLDGVYDRFSGDFAELGKGEILAWKPA
jgi:formylmethanofuran dehydrogenase subunit C